MFNDLREQLDKIRLLEEDNELDELDDGTISDNSAADDIYGVDGVDEEAEDMEDEDADAVENGNGGVPSLKETIDAIVESIAVRESACACCGKKADECTCGGADDDYEDDDEDSIDYSDGVIGNGDDDMLYDDDDEEDSFSAEIDGTTNSIKLDEDIYEDFEEPLDELLEAYGDDIDGIGATNNELYGDPADYVDNPTPPTPMHEKPQRIRQAGRLEPSEEMPFNSYDPENPRKFDKFGHVLLDKSLLSSPAYDDDDFEDDGDDYDLYASAGDIYDDDENEEFYGIRDQIRTKSLMGRHSVNNINAAKLDDRFAGAGDALDEDLALDESVSAFLTQYLQ